MQSRAGSGGSGQSGSGSGRGSAKSPASLRSRAMIATSSAVSSSDSPGSANTSVLSASVARSTSSRPECREHEHRGPSVARVRLALDQAVAHEPVDGVRDARGVHLQARDRAGHRHPSLAGEAEQAQHLVPGERQPERLEGRVDAREHELLGADDRGDGGHAGSGIRPIRARSTGASPRRSDRRAAVLISASSRLPSGAVHGSRSSGGHGASRARARAIDSMRRRSGAQ